MTDASSTTRFDDMIAETLERLSVVLGPDMAYAKAQAVPGLHLTRDGKVDRLEGDPQEILQQLIDTYVDLSGDVVYTTLERTLERFPEMSKYLKEHAPTGGSTV